MAYAATGFAVAAAAIARAIKASGAIVRVDPPDFLSILSRTENPLVVLAESGFLKANYQYLVGYKGLVFFTRSPTPLQLPSKAELVRAKKIWIPG